MPTSRDEIRDVLIETFTVNDAMNQLLLAHLDPRAWRAKPPRSNRMKAARLRRSSRIFTTLASCGCGTMRRI
jgi:hypothetical protein